MKSCQIKPLRSTQRTRSYLCGEAVYYCCMINHPKTWPFRTPTIFFSWVCSVSSSGRFCGCCFGPLTWCQSHGDQWAVIWETGKAGPLSLFPRSLGLSCPPGPSIRGPGLLTWQLSASQSTWPRREEAEAYTPYCLDSKPKNITSFILYDKVAPGSPRSKGWRQASEASAAVLRAHVPE